MDDIFKLHADICKTFTNPKRLEIISVLQDAEMSAGQLLKQINISKANLSQHMSILIQKGIVIARREGINVFYSLSDKRITKACDLMREVLIKKLEQDSKVLEKIKKGG